MRFPGLYIPPLPPKTLTGKTEAFTLLERHHFLNLFLKECCEYKYLTVSVELQTFLRPAKTEIEKALREL